jgi:GT2 family glycosyltransferase
VVLLNYNRWEDTLRCLGGVDRQTLSPGRVIVVDNASSDDSARRLAQARPDVELVESPANLGFAGGNNLGVSLAREMGADYIWLLNNDALPLPDALRALVDMARADPALGAVGSVVLEDDGSEQVQVWGGGAVSFAWGLPHHHKQPVPTNRLDYLNAASLLLRCQALDQVGGGLDPGFFLFWEDTDLCFRLRRAGWDLATSPESRVLHRGSASIGFQSPLWDRHFTRSSVRFFRRHAAFWPWPVLISAGGRLLARAAAGRWRNMAAVARGLAEGLTAPSPNRGGQGGRHA